MKSNAFWTKKYKQNIGKMIGVCYRYVLDRDLAEDLAHDAFLKAIEKADSFRGLGRFDAWLMRITVNTTLQYLRNNRSQILDDIPEDQLEELPAEEEQGGDEVMEIIRKADFTQEEIVEAVGQLPEHHRVVFNLYVFDHFTHKQIAEERGISENTSKSHLARARKELQQILFNKSKDKKKTLMAILLLLQSYRSHAMDRWCHRALKNFALSPANPMSSEQLAALAGNMKLLSPIGMYQIRVPLAIGTSTALIGSFVAMGLNQPKSSPPKSHPSAIVTSDSSTTVEPTRPTPVPKQVTLFAPNEQEDAVLTTDSATEEVEASAEPVVIKKIIQKRNTIVIVQDTNQH